MIEALTTAHIAAAALMLGATVINGILHGRARRAVPAEARALLGGVLAVNRWVMAPSLVVLPVSGIWLALRVGYDFGVLWLGVGIGLAALLLLAFLIGARFERRLALLAAGSEPEALDARYGSAFACVAPIGLAALGMGFAAVAVMVIKPV